ncbi:DJ-1/PfpI family protein [Nocardia gipuzkoensis]
MALKTGTPPPIEGARASDYHALFIPGGLAPSELRVNEQALRFVREFAETGRPVGALCHGPQMLISAGLVCGRRMTSWREVAPEITAAGATYVDEALVEDGQFLTARKPGDMPVRMHRLLTVLDRRRAHDEENA